MTAGWGLSSSGVIATLRPAPYLSVALSFALSIVTAGTAAAGPAEPTTAPDPPPRAAQPAVGPSSLPPSWDLDGLYVWLGPLGAAGRLDGDWDSAFGS